MGKVPTEMEIVLEQTQQGTSYEVLVSVEGVEELKRKVKIKGEKKEAIFTLRQKPGDSNISHHFSSGSGIEKVAVCSIVLEVNEVLKLKNFKKDVDPEVTRSQEGKDYKMANRDYAWLMILRCSKDHIQVKNKIQAKD
ncbi:hypothetical protein Tco_0570404 [Tanacetum coccineum]